MFTILLSAVGVESQPRLARATYSRFERADPYVQVHQVSFPLADLQTDLDLEVVFEEDVFLDARSLSSMIQSFEKRSKRKAYAAINVSFESFGDYFSAIPRGPLVVKGVPFVSSTQDPIHPSFFLSPSGVPGVGHLSLVVKFLKGGKSLGESGLHGPRFAGDAVLFTDSSLLPTTLSEGASLFRLNSSDLKPLTVGAIRTKTVQLIDNSNLDPAPASHLSDWFLLVLDRSRMLPVLTRLSLGAEEIEIVAEVERVQDEAFCFLANDLNASFQTEFVVGAGRMLLLPGEKKGAVPEYVHRTSRLTAPRSGLCWDKNQMHFVTVDGIRPGFWKALESIFGAPQSHGMTILELAKYMRDELGCSCGIEFDGGKSATLYHQGRLVNSPASGREHPVRSGIILTDRASS